MQAPEVTQANEYSKDKKAYLDAISKLVESGRPDIVVLGEIHALTVKFLRDNPL